MRPQFSVIIPARNIEQYVGLTLESVFNQTETGFEVIVVDDGSTDTTREVVEKSGLPVRLFRSTGMGAGAARNLGASKSQGEYLCFLDGDDLWFPWVLKTFSWVIDRAGGVPWIIGCSSNFSDEADWSALAEKQEEEVDVPEYTELANLLQTHRQYQQIHTGTHAIRRDVFFASGGYSEDLGCLEDGDLYLKLSTVGPLVILNAPILLGYRQRDGSTSLIGKTRNKDCFSVYAGARSGTYATEPLDRRRQMIIASRYFRPVLADLAYAGRAREFFHYYLRILWPELLLLHFKIVFFAPAVCLLSMVRNTIGYRFKHSGEQ